MNHKLPTTKDEFINEHRKMWTWIANETLRRKEKVEKYQYLSHNVTKVVYNDCWLCDYVYLTHKGHCEYCPLKWLDTDGNEVNWCWEPSNSLYQAWNKEENYQKAYELAYKIDNLQTTKEK